MVKRGAVIALTSFLFTKIGYATGNHQVTVASQQTLMRSSLDASTISVSSPLGIAAGYAYKSGFDKSFFLQYMAAVSGSNLILHGITCGFDYAILGGQNKTAQVVNDSIYEFEFPYRVGLNLAVAQRIYNFGSLEQSANIFFEKTVPITGTIIGIEAGASFELPLNQTTSIVSKGTFILPSFPDQATQKGSIFTFSLGIGLQL